MPNIRMIESVLREYGASWMVYRAMYSAKLELLRTIPLIDKVFEKRTAYPKRLDLFRVDVSALKSFLQGLCETEKTALLEEADRAVKGIITGFSCITLNYGSPLDWQKNPLTGKSCDKTLKWYQIPDFDSDRGDIKVIWEASRFSHFITLCRAFLLTGEKRYYRAFSDQLSDWLEQNKYGCGANYKCGQECSLRMVNALLAYTVFRACGIATDADASNIRDLIDRCYRKVLANFFYAYRCIKNNHTISELMGMIVGAWCCEDKKRLNKAFALLDRIIDEQFTRDGGYKQFSFNYQRLALQDIECILSVGDRIGNGLSDHSKERIRNAAFLMYQCQDESGDLPNYGSNDGALVFPLTSCNYRDFRPVINTVYALITGKQLYADGPHQEELLWFSDGHPLEAFEMQYIERKSEQFPDAGLFTIRGKQSWAMIVSNDYKSRPSHMDQLHFDLWINGKNVLCDAGTYSYADKLGKQMIQCRSHNTAVVSGIAQMNTKGPFLVYDWTERVFFKHQVQAFEGTTRSKNGYRHTRHIIESENAYEITDRVDSDFDVVFNTPCDVESKDNKAILFDCGRYVCEIVSSVNIEKETAMRSLFYLKKEPIVCLVLHGHADTSITTRIKLFEGEKND